MRTEVEECCCLFDFIVIVVHDLSYIVADLHYWGAEFCSVDHVFMLRLQKNKKHTNGPKFTFLDVCWLTGPSSPYSTSVASTDNDLPRFLRTWLDFQFMALQCSNWKSSHALCLVAQTSDRVGMERHKVKFSFEDNWNVGHTFSSFLLNWGVMMIFLVRDHRQGSPNLLAFVPMPWQALIDRVICNVCSACHSVCPEYVPLFPLILVYMLLFACVVRLRYICLAPFCVSR